MPQLELIASCTEAQDTYELDCSDNNRMWYGYLVSPDSSKDYLTPESIPVFTNWISKVTRRSENDAVYPFKVGPVLFIGKATISPYSAQCPRGLLKVGNLSWLGTSLRILAQHIHALCLPLRIFDQKAKTKYPSTFRTINMVYTHTQTHTYYIYI